MNRSMMTALFLAAPLTAQQISPTQIRGTAVVQTPAQGQSVSGVKSFNSILYADNFSGSDIGAKVNAAFATCSGTSGSPAPSCRVELEPEKTYTYSTKIVMPNTRSSPYIVAPEIDCHHSKLVWSGTGDAISVLFDSGNQPTGRIQNCLLVNEAGNTDATNGIHQLSRVAFSYHYVSVTGFTSGAGILIDNVPIGSDPYWNERTVFDRVTTENDQYGLRFMRNGGTNSYAYTSIYSGECNAGDGQICLSIEGDGSIFQSGDFYSAFIDIKGNIAADTTAARFVSVTGGGNIRNSLVHITAEEQGAAQSYLFYVDASNSYVQASGNTFGGGLVNYTASTSDTLNVPQMDGYFTIQAVPYATGVLQQRNSKLIFNNSLRYGMAYDGAVNGIFQLFGRETGPSDPEVDATPSSGSIQYNMMFCTNNPSNPGCGFGSGYGLSATTGGTNTPAHALEYNGNFGSRNGAFDVDSAGNITINNLKATGIHSITGSRYVCVDTNGNFFSSATACSGT